jgi:hypothetical protein
MKRATQVTRRGQSLVEFALVLPILLLMAVMIFDLGRAVYYSSTIHNAAREGARYGIVHPDDVPGMKQKAIDYAIGLDLQDSDIDVSLFIPEVRSSFPPPKVTVIVNYDYVPATPLVSQLIPSGYIALRGEAVMKLEALPDN